MNVCSWFTFRAALNSLWEYNRVAFTPRPIMCDGLARYSTVASETRIRTPHVPQSKPVVIVIVIPRFLQHPQKRNRGRPLTRTKPIGRGNDPEIQAGRVRRLWW